MLTLPNQQLNVTEPIFLWMMTSSTEETYQNPFNLSLLEYLINRMNYNNGLKEFMIEDGRQYVCILKLNLRKFFGRKYILFGRKKSFLCKVAYKASATNRQDKDIEKIVFECDRDGHVGLLL